MKNFSNFNMIANLKVGLLLSVVTVLGLLVFVDSSQSDDSAGTTKKAERAKTDSSSDKKTSSKPSDTKKTAAKKPRAKNPLIRLHPKYPVWIDKKNKRVITEATVCMRDKGVLEMFACLKNSKEHESIIAVPGKAYIIHTALMAVGAKVGSPVDYGDPRKKIPYKAATGQEIDVTVQWTDKKGKKHSAKAQEWIKNIETKKALKHPWVFSGSGIWEDPLTKKQHYMAEAGGELISVSNFPSTTMDLPIKSSQSNEGLLYEAFTERIPPLGTKIRLILTPVVKKEKPKDKKQDQKKKPAQSKKLSGKDPK